MMPALFSGLDLRQPLQAARDMGAAFVARALDDEFQQELRHEVAPGVFEKLPEQVGRYGVRQQADLLTIVDDDFDAYPGVAELRTELVRLIRGHGDSVEGLGRWQPNEVSVQRYHPGSIGISPHLDGKRYHYLVAVFTAEGTASFVLCSDRAGTVVAEWTAGPGSLVLLRGPGLSGIEDGRPLHAVSGPVDEARVSVSFRMNTPTPSGRQPTRPRSMKRVLSC